MCVAIALSQGELPADLIWRHGLYRRIHQRSRDRPEVRFFYWDQRPRLPIVRDGRFQIVRWGNGRGQSRFLPRTGWTWTRTIREGGWQHLPTTEVVIPATYALERRGVWYLVSSGVRGLLVPDERGFAVAYMICEPSSHYYRIMTGSERMPTLIEQRSF